MTKENYVDEVNNGREEMLKAITICRELDEPQQADEYRDPLSIDTFIEKKILLSWGGPEDGFKLRFDSEKKLIGGVYYRADWGKYKESDLTDKEAQEVYDFYLGGYIE